MSKSILSITETAAHRIKEILESKPGAIGLLLGLKKGGCAGMEYNIALAYEEQEGAALVEQRGASVFVERSALLYVLGTELDYQETPLKAGFVFNNPNQTAACGCGESVTLKASSSI